MMDSEERVAMVCDEVGSISWFKTCDPLLANPGEASRKPSGGPATTKVVEGGDC